MEFVEEVDSSDNNSAFIVSNVIGIDALSEDYYGKIRSLHYLMEDTK